MLAFQPGILFCLVNNLITPFLRQGYDLCSPLFTLPGQFHEASPGELQFMTTLFTGSQSIRNRFFAFFQRVNDRWPDKLETEPRKNRKRDHLAYQCSVEIHIISPSSN